jgi:outer membrane protein TolC
LGRLSIYDSQVETFEKLLENTKEIRNLTIRKRNLGLSEGFEINQWNAVYSKTESLLEKAKMQRLQKERDLVRILNVDPNSKISGVTDLYDKPPKSTNIDKDTEYAYKNRLDIIMNRRSMEMAGLGLENATENQKAFLKGIDKIWDQLIKITSQQWTIGHRPKVYMHLCIHNYMLN